MRLADGELVAFELRELGGEAEELLHADGEVGAVEQAAAAAMAMAFISVKMRVPAGSADHDAASERENGAHIFDRGIGSGEIDDGVDAGESWAR